MLTTQIHALASRVATEVKKKVSGPASSTIGHIPVFNSTGGKSVSDSGIHTDDLVLGTDEQVSELQVVLKAQVFS